MVERDGRVEVVVDEWCLLPLVVVVPFLGEAETVTAGLLRSAACFDLLDTCCDDDGLLLELPAACPDFRREWCIGPWRDWPGTLVGSGRPLDVGSGVWALRCCVCVRPRGFRGVMLCCWSFRG